MPLERALEHSAQCISSASFDPFHWTRLPGWRSPLRIVNHCLLLGESFAQFHIRADDLIAISIKSFSAFVTFLSNPKLFKNVPSSVRQSCGNRHLLVWQPERVSAGKEAESEPFTEWCALYAYYESARLPSSREFLFFPDRIKEKHM